MRLKDKVAIITGAAAGLGEDNARLFAEEGAKVVVADIDDDKGKAVVRDIVVAGGDAVFFHLDVTREDDWQHAVKETVRRYGKVDILVNNVGISIKSPGLVETSVEAWDKINDTNAKGTFLGVKTVLPEMIKAGGGSIVNISSPSAMVGGDNAAAYHASKGAIRAFTKSVATDYAPLRIRCNSIHPGPYEVGMISQFVKDPDTKRKHLESLPMGRYGKPREESYGVLYLASDESTFTTGAELAIDGGRIVRGGSLRGMA